MECSNRFPSFGRFDEVRGLFWGTKCAKFGSATPNLAPLARGTTSEFLAENLVSAKPPPRE